jgi:hypothetical protein
VSSKLTESVVKEVGFGHEVSGSWEMTTNVSDLIPAKIPPFWRDNAVEIGLRRESRQNPAILAGQPFTIQTGARIPTTARQQRPGRGFPTQSRHKSRHYVAISESFSGRKVNRAILTGLAQPACFNTSILPGILPFWQDTKVWRGVD